MESGYRNLVRILCCLLLAGGLAACTAGQNYTYYDNAREVPEGPGLLTGDQGKFEYTLKLPER